MNPTDDRLSNLDAAFRAANYLGAAQIYLRDNVLLQQPLQASDIKPRLLGHWGTQPGLNLVYAHLNRLIQDTDAQMLLVVGPGHGAPAILANLWLEGTLQHYYPELGSGAAGLARFVHSFSWPGGFPSHLTAQAPGTIHEGGELGYCLLHAYGAVLDNPELIAACVIGDGEAETGPLAASWHSAKFIDPTRDGAVLPILHLNGYKLSGPSILARMADGDLLGLLAGHGYDPIIVAGDIPLQVHRDLWRALDVAHHSIRLLQQRLRAGDDSPAPRWPAIVLRTPKGWTGPASLHGHAIEGTFHAHQVPITNPRTDSEHLAAVDAWLRSYRPEELFDASTGTLSPAVEATLPPVHRRLGRSPHANGGTLRTPLVLPDYGACAVEVATPGAKTIENTRVLGVFLRDVFRRNADAHNFRLFCPDETMSNRLEAVFEATARAFEEPLVATDEYLTPDGRVMEILSEHCCEGWLEGYLQTGRHGIIACYEAFIGIIDSMMAQYAKWQKMAAEVPWREPVASLNYLLASHVWEQDHNGYSHQGPTFINTMLTKKAAQTRIYLPPDANCLLSVADHCLRSTGCVNLIVASKKPMPQWLPIDAARMHCRAGVSTWGWAGTESGGEPDLVLACAGDVPTRETIAAAWWLRSLLPELQVRVVNVVDLFALESRDDHPHGLADDAFAALFTVDQPIVFAFHGYPMLIHELIYRRPNPDRFHVHGYREEGTTTTPFDMLTRNGMSRYDLAIAGLRRVRRLHGRIGAAIQTFEAKLAAHRQHIAMHGDDMPEVTQWRWTE